MVCCDLFIRNKSKNDIQCSMLCYSYVEPGIINKKKKNSENNNYNMTTVLNIYVYSYNNRRISDIYSYGDLLCHFFVTMYEYIHRIMNYVM